MKKIFLLLVILPVLAFSQKTNYFQQKVNYYIHVKVNPKNKTLSAFERLVYYNNSPDTLHFIIFHLWPNAYQPGTALAKQMANNGNGIIIFGPKQYRGYIDSLNFKANNQKLKWHNYKKHKDIAIVYLNKPLAPGDSVTITTPFSVKIPKCSSRMGYDDKVISITQWYPKPAVFDKYGWHPLPYLDQGEFYSEFGTFNVWITIPKNYAVAATGNLLNKNELHWLLTLEKKQTMANNLNNPAKSNLKTLHYQQSNIHDFAFFVSKYFYVKHDTVTLPHSHRKITTWTFFTSPDKWQNAINYVDSAIFYYSKWVGDYPYNVCTAVQGPLGAGGGMEYPTITVIASNTKPNSLQYVIVHEVGHNWFYGALGFNERRFPFLDEGINTCYDHRYARLHPSSAKIVYGNLYWFEAPFALWMNINQPLNLTSTDYSSISYDMTVYEKTAQAFRYLRHYLGSDQFDTIMHQFYETWKFKHPYPSDLKKFFLSHAHKDVSWFFNQVIPTNKLIDYKVKLKKNKVKISNTGQIKAPMLIKFITDNKTQTKWVMLKPHSSTTININASKAFVDPKHQTLDWNIYNNFSNSILFSKKFKISIFPIFKYKANAITMLPMINWREFEHFMPGFYIGNIALPLHRLTLNFGTFYSFSLNKIFNSIYLYYWRPTINGFPSINFSISADNFYNPFNTSKQLRYLNTKLQLGFFNKYASDKWSKTLTLNLFLIRLLNGYQKLFQTQFAVSKHGKYHPFNAYVSSLIGLPSLMINSALSYKAINYVSLQTGLNIRLFANLNSPLQAMNTFTDYTWSHHFPFKFVYNKLFANQIAEYYGLFILKTPKILYNYSLGSNITSTLPIKKTQFLQGFFNLAYADSQTYWETGIVLKFNDLHIYFPLTASQNLLKANPDFSPFKYFKFSFQYKLSYKNIFSF